MLDQLSQRHRTITWLIISTNSIPSMIRSRFDSPRGRYLFLWKSLVASSRNFDRNRFTQRHFLEFVNYEANADVMYSTSGSETPLSPFAVVHIRATVTTGPNHEKHLYESGWIDLPYPMSYCMSTCSSTPHAPRIPPSRYSLVSSQPAYYCSLQVDHIERLTLIKGFRAFRLVFDDQLKNC